MRCIVVLHFNHPREITEETAQATHTLGSVAALLNQSVLLRGVNDNARDLIELSERLFDTGVIPYYLHLLDRVRGAAHFEVDQSTAGELMVALRHSLPGYLVPRLVRDQEGQAAKTLIV